MTDNHGTGADGALEFLRKHKAIWSAWVTPEAADKSRASI